MDCVEVRKVDSSINVRLATRFVCARRSLIRAEHGVGCTTHDNFAKRCRLADTLDAHGVNELPVCP